MRSPLFILFAVLIVLLAAGTYIYISNNQPSTIVVGPTPSPVVAEVSPSQDLLQGGASYSDPSSTYSFLYPNDYKLDTSDIKHVRIYKTGPTQKGQTEIYDGAIIVFEVVNLEGKTLEVWTNDYIKSLTADGTAQVVEQSKLTTLNKFPAYTFSIRGLGESQYVVAQKDGKSTSAIVITSMVADPTSVGFQSQVDSTLNSVQLLK